MLVLIELLERKIKIIFFILTSIRSRIRTCPSAIRNNFAQEHCRDAAGRDYDAERPLFIHVHGML